MKNVRKSGLSRYIDARLGKGSESEQIRKMFKKSFQAKTFREFWWYWNPPYGFFLAKYIFKPLKKFFPESVSVIFTFLACGLFLHDLPIILSVLLLEGFLLPFPITIVFTILGVINVLSTKYKLSFAEIKPYGRIVIHSLTLIGSWIIAITVIRIIIKNLGIL